VLGAMLIGSLGRKRIWTSNPVSIGVERSYKIWNCWY